MKVALTKGYLVKLWNLLNPYLKKPEFIVILGDSVVGSPDLSTLKTQLEDFKSIIWSNFPSQCIFPVIGNHEIGKGCDNSGPEEIFTSIYSDLKPEGALDVYNNTVYYKDFYNTRIIVLNFMKITIIISLSLIYKM